MKIKNAKYFCQAFLLGSLCLGISACTEGTTTASKVSTQKIILPDEATSFLSSYFAEAAVDTVSVDDDGSYDVTLDNKIDLSFRYDGEWSKIILHKNELSKDQLEMLPVRTLTYLQDNLPGFAIRRMERNSSGYYLVLGKPYNNEVYFSRMGTFLPNVPQNLPSNVKVILKKYFTTDTIHSVILDEDKIYNIVLNSGTYLEFDRMGRFERIDTKKSDAPIPPAFINSLPELMVKYIQKNYPNKKYRKVIRKSYGYYVKLTPNSVELRFSKAGDYLRNANSANHEDED